MADIDPSIILSAKAYQPSYADSVQSGQQIAMNKQQIVGNQQRQQLTALQIQDAQTEQSDNTKLTTAMQGLDPSAPDYSDKLIASAKSAGVSGKTLIQLQQNMLKQKSQNLDNENQSLVLKENYLKLDSAKRAAYDQQLDGALGDMQDIDKAWKDSGGNSAIVSTKIAAHLKEEVDGACQ